MSPHLNHGLVQRCANGNLENGIQQDSVISMGHPGDSSGRIGKRYFEKGLLAQGSLLMQTGLMLYCAGQH
jgi:hypothetical protein